MPDILYTGKGLTPDIKSDGGAAMSRLSNFITKAEEIKTNAFNKNKEWLNKMQDIDPVLLLTTASQNAQQEAMQEFNNAAAAVVKESGDLTSLSNDAQNKIRLAKGVLISKQQEMQAAQAKAMADKEAIEKDIRGDLNHDDWKKRWDDYMTTGKYDMSPLKPSAINPDEFYNKTANKVNGTPGNVPVKRTVNGTEVVEWFKSSGTEEEGRALVRAQIGSDDRLAMGFVEKFQKLKETDPETYIKYLDTTGDGKVDSNEEQAASSMGNPIMEWALDTYGKKAIDINTTKPTKLSTTSTKFDFDINIGPGNNRNNEYDVQGYWCIPEQRVRCSGIHQF